MRSLFHTPAARADLLEIWVYIAEDSFPAADKVLAAIDRRCQIIAETPGIGRTRDELEPGLRSIVSGKYIIFYRVHEQRIEIVRVLHDARDIDSIFRTE